MALRLRTATPASDPSLATLIDAAFQSVDRESRLVRELAAGYPRFDAGLSLVADRDGEPAGWALFVPRTLRIRDAWVPLAVAGPYATLPKHRGSGVMRFLFSAGLTALADRGLRGAVSIGDPDVLSSFGFTSAFNLVVTHASDEHLPDEGDTRSFVGLSSKHLPELIEMHGANYEHSSGSEQRLFATVDWAPSVPDSYVLVYEKKRRARGYVRFRIRECIEVPECGATDAEAVDAVLRFLRRLAREHGRRFVDVYGPPSHPVVRALFHLGATRETTNLSGAAMLHVTDWPGLLEDTAPSWCEALRRAGVDACSIGIGAASYRLRAAGSELRVDEGRTENAHVEVPDEWATSLVTGQRCHLDLDDAAPARSEDLRRLRRELFPPGEPMWTYSPVFEVVAD